MFSNCMAQVRPMHARAFDELSRFTTAFSRRQSFWSLTAICTFVQEQEEDCRYNPCPRKSKEAGTEGTEHRGY
jgi:hypothetical protein